MMFRDFDKPEDRVRLHSLSDRDNIEQIFPCSHSEWVQLLMSVIGNDRWKVWAYVDEEDEIHAYLVAFNAVAPPLNDHVQLVYYWTDLPTEKTREVLEIAKDWARVLNARRIRFTTRLPSRVFEKYGFEQSEITMELKV